MTCLFYSNEDRCIVKSSISNVSYFETSDAVEDPWITITDHVANDNVLEDTVYGEASYPEHSASIKYHKGGNVWIRQIDGNTRDCSPTSYRF